MEFWGIEVKPGETVKCEPGDDKYLHLSQASLGESKKEKGNESIPLYLKFDDKQLVIGTLSADKCPQITYDLVFEKEFELSHSWKNGSVFFVGYKTEIPDEGPDDFMGDFESESEEEETPVKKEANGKPKSKEELAKPKANAPKADSLAAKPGVKAEELKKATKEDENDDSEEDEDESDEDESDDEDMLNAQDDSSDEDEDESSEEEDDKAPKKPEIGKKRPAESALKTPASDKKAKFPGGGQKTGGTEGKKGGHVATPHPAKQAGKTPATNDKSKQQTPKSAGSVSCKSCSKTFKDDNALQAHTKAKHAAK